MPTLPVHQRAAVQKLSDLVTNDDELRQVGEGGSRAITGWNHGPRNCQEANASPSPFPRPSR